MKHWFRIMTGFQLGNKSPDVEKNQQERLKRWNTLGCLDQYAAQNSKYARPPIPSQPPTQKVFFQSYTQYDPTMKHSHCETVYAKGLFQWLFLELVHSLRILSIFPISNKLVSLKDANGVHKKFNFVWVWN